MDENNADLNRTHGEDLSEEYEVQKYETFNSFEPPKTPQEMNEEFGAEPEPNFAAENYNPDLDNTGILDPNDLEPPIPFYGRTDDPSAMEAAYEDDQNAGDDEEEPPSEASTAEDEKAEEQAAAAVQVEEMPSGEETTPPENPSKEDSGEKSPETPPEETTTNPEDTPDYSSEKTEATTPPATEDNPAATAETKEIPPENTEPKQEETEPKTEPPKEETPKDETSPKEGEAKEEESKEPQKKQLLCPHCGKRLYVQTIGGMKLYRHMPEDAKHCDAMFNSISEVIKTQAEIEEKKAKLAKMTALQQQQELEHAKLVAAAKNASNANKSNYSSFVSDADKKKEEEAKKQPTASIDSGTLSALMVQMAKIMENQTALKTSFDIEVKNWKESQEKLLTSVDTLSKGLSSMQEAMAEIDPKGAAEKLQEVGTAIDSTMQELQAIKPIPGLLKAQMEKLERDVSDSLSATRNAGEQFDLYTHSVRKLQSTNARLNVMIPYLEKYLEETDQRYESMLDQYGEKQKEFGNNFKKIYRQLNLSNGTSMPPLYGYLISFVLAFVLMMIYDFIR